MKKVVVFVLIALFISTSAHAIGISFSDTSGGTLEDAILIASVAGAPPRDAVALGDFDLSAATDFVFDVPVDAGMTDWWLIGHQAGNVVYSSNLDLNGVEMYSIEPYDIAMALDWDIPGNLDAYVNGGAVSFDWWAQTVFNHSSHVAADGATSNLWRFASPGHSFGSVAVSLYTNTPPGGGQPPEEPPIPEPSTIFLLGFGLIGLLGLGRKKFFKN